MEWSADQPRADPLSQPHPGGLEGRTLHERLAGASTPVSHLQPTLRLGRRGWNSQQTIPVVCIAIDQPVGRRVKEDGRASPATEVSHWSAGSLSGVARRIAQQKCRRSTLGLY